MSASVTFVRSAATPPRDDVTHQRDRWYPLIGSGRGSLEWPQLPSHNLGDHRLCRMLGTSNPDNRERLGPCRHSSKSGRVNRRCWGRL